jgi:hypothetical protein
MSYFTNLTVKETAFLLFQVAHLRVLGKSWELIAADLKLPVGEMRQFLFDKDAELALWIRKARRSEREFCVDEAVQKLRQQCQSSNEKMRHSASCSLLRLHMAELRYRDNLRKAKLKKSLPPTMKKLPTPIRIESACKSQSIHTLPMPKFSSPQSLDFSQLPSNIQLQTAELAKRLEVKV